MLQSQTATKTDGCDRKRGRIVQEPAPAVTVSVPVSER